MTLGAIVLLATLLAPGSARAQSEARERVARQHFRVAERHFAHEDFEEAFREYETAYAIAPLPGFLFNMGQCQRKLGNRDRAVNFYTRYLEEAPDAANRSVVERFLRDLGAEPPRVGSVDDGDADRPPPPEGDPPAEPPPTERPARRRSGGVAVGPIVLVGSGLALLLASGSLALYTADRTDDVAETLQLATFVSGLVGVAVGSLWLLFAGDADEAPGSTELRLSSALVAE